MSAGGVGFIRLQFSQCAQDRGPLEKWKSSMRGYHSAVSPSPVSAGGVGIFTERKPFSECAQDLCTLEEWESSLRVDGKKCFECTDIPDPTYCRKVAECPDDDDCFVEEAITTGGIVFFNTGCRPKERCIGTGKRREIVERGDIDICDECCTEEFCNIQGCRKLAPDRKSRGPYCFSCDAQTSETNCRNVALCASDEACLISYSEVDGFYKTSCVHQTQCDALNSQFVFGKRGTVHLTTCATCCHEDFCNDNCSKVTVPIDGHWSEWGQWTACSKSCDQGVKTRSRSCNNPPPSNNGMTCPGDVTMTTPCTANACLVSVNGGWSEWSQWSTCSHTCGHGNHTRSRSCTNPTPQNGGKPCEGHPTQVGHCTNHLKCGIDEATCQSAGYTWYHYGTPIYGCLKLFKVNHEWAGGLKTCHDSGGQLYAAQTVAKEHLMEAFLKSERVAETFNIWIGLTTKLIPQKWAWYGQPLTAMTYHKFHNQSLAEPPQHGNQCAVVGEYHNAFQWVSKNCYSRHFVLCEKLH